MQCSDFENRLNDLLDQRLDPSTDHDLAIHAANCPLCEQNLAGWLTLAQQLQGLSLAQHSEPELWVTNGTGIKLAQARRTDRQSHHPPRRPALLPALISAAAIWCGLMLWPGHLSEEREPARGFLTNGELPKMELAGNPAEPRLPSVAQVSQRQLAGFEDSSFAAHGQASLIQPLDFDRISANVSTPHWWGSMVVAAWKPVDPLTTSIRPLTDSFQTALQLLTPRSTPVTSTPPPAVPEDASVDHKRFLASIA